MLTRSHPQSLSPLTIGVAQAATLCGVLYAVGMVATGIAALPAAGGLGVGLMMTELGSGLLLGAVSGAGFLCATTADRVRRANNAQEAALREAEKSGVMPVRNPYHLLEAASERSPLVITTARWGSVFLGLAAALGVAMSLLSGGGASLITMGALLVGAASTYHASRVAEEALHFAEQTTRDASRAMRNETPATQWAQDPLPLVGTEYTYPPAGHFAQKYAEERALREIAAAEELRGR